jgi:hypothetical protein
MAEPTEEESLGAQLRTQLEANLRSIRLKIILLGPGEANPEFYKRSQIRDFILENLPDDEVILPEEAIPDDMKAKFGLGPAEAQLMQMGDIVIALIPPEGRAPGVFAELQDFARLPGFAEKVRIFRPDDGGDSWQGYNQQRVIGAYDVSRFIDYPVDSWPTCDYIRPHTESLIQNERRRRLNVDLLGH